MAQLLSFKSLQEKELHDSFKPSDQAVNYNQIATTTYQVNKHPDKQWDRQKDDAAPTNTASPATPVIGIRNNGKKPLFDGVSTVSKSSLSGIRSVSALDSTKHFELRWRNINLRTKAKGNLLQDLLGNGKSGYENTAGQLVAEDGSRQILTNLSGTLYSGQLTAILGPSGKFLIHRII